MVCMLVETGLLAVVLGRGLREELADVSLPLGGRVVGLVGFKAVFSASKTFFVVSAINPVL